MRSASAFAAIGLLLLVRTAVAEPVQAPPRADRPRLIVLTDIGPKLDPDDAQSMVRLLLYSDQLEIEGLVASSAGMNWNEGAVHPSYIEERIRAYAAVRPRLLDHSPSYPSARSLLATVKRGLPASGLRAVGPGKDSPGSNWIIEVVDRPDPRPVWIAVWGGPNVLAQALWKVRRTRSPEEVDRFVSKLRVYSHLDQDDSAPWLRTEFPGLFYVGTPNGYTAKTWYWNKLWYAVTWGTRYTKAAAFGMSNDDPGAPLEVVSDAWVAEHVQSHGPLGALYPSTRFALEVDSVSFLYLVPNGLGDPERPSWGSWGGRFELRDGVFQDAIDHATGVDGKRHASSYATFWRWREDVQNDFAARMDWSVAADANHPPVAALHREHDRTLCAGESVALDASPSSDPDGDRLDFEWIHYPEAGTFRGELRVHATGPGSARVEVRSVDAPGDAHVILRLRDRGAPPLARYLRIRLRVADACPHPVGRHPPIASSTSAAHSK